jgi:N6-L-threonylcarbamoyladenine synthase
LWVGVNFARTLSYFWDIPIVPVNHIEAHILVNFIDKDFQFSIFNFQKLFPAVALVVSGGHTQMILMKNFGNYKILGETRDDAAGECFDKTARILGLGYPGGPAIAKQAENYWDVIPPKALGGMTSLKLPRPMINTKDYDFSFSGLKTAVLYEHKKQSAKIRKDKKYIQAMCKEIQQAVIDVLIKKTIKAAKDSNSKTIILGGGVAANEELRKQFVEKTRALNALSARPSTQIKNLSALVQKNYNLLVPKPTLCTDNAVMTAITAYFHKTQTRNWQKIKAEANLRIGV